MADSTEDTIPRFDFLVGRFFDGLLTDGEDQELALLLDYEPTLAKRFLIQVEVERILILQGDPRRVANTEFVESVSRGVRMINDPIDSERFARQVVSLIRNSRGTAAAQMGVSRRRKSVRPAMLSPWAVAGSLAAMLAITFLVTRDTTPSAPMTPGIAVVTVPEPRAQKPNDGSKSDVAELPRMIVTPEMEPHTDVAEEHTPPLPAPTPVDFFAEDVELNARDRNAVAAASTQTQERPTPKKAAEPVVGRPESATLSELGRVAPAIGCTAVLRRPGVAGGEMSVRRLEVAGEGDLIRVGALEASPSDPQVANAGCEIRLNDGTRMWLKPNSALRMRQANGAFRPILESGEALVHAAKQKPGTPLTLATAQGAEARVLGTVFTVKAEPQNKRVMLYVEEGKVAFSHRGEERIILADEACLAEDGKSPTLPYQYRPRACSLTGTVMEREKNTPVAGATVIAAPIAQLGGTPIQYKAETNAQGKYTFDALPEGSAFVYVISEVGGDRVKGRGTVMRTRIESGAKNTANVTLDSALLVNGRVTENGKGLSDYRVRLVRQGSDGLSFNAAKSGTLTWKMADGDYNDGFTFVAVEGPGRYIPIIERKGLLAKLRYGNLNDLRPDRATQWFMDATFSPSALLKGRIANASGATLGDDPAKLKDPHHVRSIVTLKSATGQPQIALADASGEFVFDTNLSTGLYELRVERFGFKPDVRQLTLVEGKTLELTVQLKDAAPAYRK